MSETTLQRLRIKYRHSEELRFIAHLDLLRAFERALRRAGLPVASSRGFNPRPRLTWAAPLPLGFVSEMELVDCLLEQPLPPSEFAARLAVQLPPGLTLLSVEEVPRSAPSLPATLRQMRYSVRVPDWLPNENAREAVERALAAPQIERPKRPKGRQMARGSYDLRPRIIDLEVLKRERGVELEMLLCAGENDTARPEEVLAALGYTGSSALITRTDMIFADQLQVNAPADGKEGGPPSDSPNGWLSGRDGATETDQIAG